MLDTNTVSYILKGKSPQARAKLSGLASDEFACISAITEAEICYGFAKRPYAQLLRSVADGFLAKIPVLPWSRQEALIYGELRAKLEAFGKTLGTMDMLIAAHAIAAEAILVTSDKAFSRVGNLSAVVNWATDL